MTGRLLLVLGALAVRIAFALATRHVGFDMEVMFAMRKALLEHGFRAYLHVLEWVYPPGFMPWLLAGPWIGDRLGVPRDFTVRAPSILADAALTLIVATALERRGASRRLAITAASLVAFGPMYVVVSAYNGQIDALAVLPAVIAVLLWARQETPARALVCGVLIGIGAALKTVPFFMVLALLPTARSWRERAAVTGFAAAVPVVLSLPFTLAAPATARQILQYSGIPGLGGWSMILLPRMTRAWFHLEPFETTTVALVLYGAGAVVSLSSLALVAALLVRKRTAPLEAASTIWLTVYSCSLSVFPQYTIWAFPFLLLAGRVREVAALSALLLPVSAIVYAELPSAAILPYRVFAILLHFAFVTMWVRDVRRLAGR